ncbi:MAG: hypothetical protein E7Z90_02595 [Cyanobacteria bacterium SIG29]|nr:hypothetical protein [Cyanobacteria bacterium SIG29]
MSYGDYELKLQNYNNVSSSNEVKASSEVDDSLSVFENEYDINNEDFSNNLYNVSSLSKEDEQIIILELEAQLEELEANFELAQNSNGWISGIWNGFKNLTGIGASSNKTQKQVDELKAQLKDLKEGKSDLSTTYKNITGKDLTSEELTKFITGETSLLNDSKAGEAVNKYSEGQKMSTDIVADILAGVASVGAVAIGAAVGICAAPFTAGASLGMIAAGVGIGAGVGAAVKVAIKGSDCIGNEKEYKLKDVGYDLLTGSINGAMGPVSNGLGSAAGTAAMKAMGMEALETTVKSGLKTTAKRALATTANMMVDGTLSGATDGFARALGEGRIEDIPEDMLQGAVGGAIASPIIGGGFNLAGKAGGKIGGIISNKLGKEASEEIAEEVTSKISREISGEVGEEVIERASIEIGSEVAEEVGEEITERTSMEIGSEIAEEVTNNGSKIKPWHKVAYSDITSTQLDRATSLINQGVETSNAYLLATSLNDAEFAQAIELISKNIDIEHIPALAKTDSVRYNEIINALSEEGADINQVAKLLAREQNFKSLDRQVVAELNNQAIELHKLFARNMDEAKAQYQKAFGDSFEITGRAKSESSIFKKLANKTMKGKLNSTAWNECYDAIGDGYGLRITLKPVDSEISDKIIRNGLKNSSLDYDDFIQILQKNNLENLDDSTKKIVIDITNQLKEEQTKDMVSTFCRNIENGTVSITEINNYGDLINSYFSPKQVKEIINSYYAKSIKDSIGNDTISLQEIKKYVIGGNEAQNIDPTVASIIDKAKQKVKPLDVVTQLDDLYNGKGAQVEIDDDNNTTVKNADSIIKNKGAKKDSGYTSFQTNVKIKLSDGTIGNGELQIRGSILNDFADVEHIPYDIRTDKIFETDGKYAPIMKIIKKMSPEEYEIYCKEYLQQEYNYLIQLERGIQLEPPNIEEIMKNTSLTPEELKMISKDGLIAFNKSLH